MADINQDDIDKLLQGDLEENEASPPAAPAELPEVGVASQDDIDALFSSIGNGEPAIPAAPTEPPKVEGDAMEGPADQDDIDALFASIGSDEPAAMPQAEADKAELAGLADKNANKNIDNDDIDALFASIGSDEPAAMSQAEADKAEPAGLADKNANKNIDNDDIDAVLASIDGDEPDPPVHADHIESETDVITQHEFADQDDGYALLTSVESSAPAQAKTVDAAPTAALAVSTDSGAGNSDADANELEEILKQVNDDAPPPLEKKRLETEKTVLLEPSAPPPPVPPSTPPPPEPPPPASLLPETGRRREFTVTYEAGELTSAVNQISALVSSLAEKANGYMQAWIGADSEAKELRTRALAEERRRSSLEGERTALLKELDDIRRRMGELEGGKLAAEEAGRGREAALEAKVRDLETQVSLLRSEADSLKTELTLARTQSTGIDIESRRARFEADRLKSEVESERMERLRIQRALENREKELQTLQAQASGQASSLFIDELHRLVRRLESELDSRTAGAHEALKQLDRLEMPETMVPVAANLRAALLQALGAEDGSDDALKTLGREASGVRGPAALTPGRTELLSFETAISTYDLANSIAVAGVLLREARATPSLLMRKIYQCPALRRPELGDHLPDLARLLEGLRTVQESNDRSRGAETGESEVFYVQMFDFLHNLVRLKIVTRLAGEVWRIFLDLRGRFSFVTSDRQWAEYRDSTLGNKGAKT
ncbi:MAG: hypothetical protein LBU23_09960 [Planctomycetota bacterium]|jgi:hypothetical protein|nr:hypothetical protein [Planctomycetota bacterium]